VVADFNRGQQSSIDLEKTNLQHALFRYSAKQLNTAVEFPILRRLR
jgi:hypothetical protein